MTTAAAAKSKPRSVEQIVREMRAEIQIMDRRNVDVYIRMGGLLIELQAHPDLKGKWQKFVRDTFPFSDDSARAYMQAYRQAQANRKPRRVSEAYGPRSTTHHQSRDFTAWTAERARARAAQHERMEAPDRAHSGMSDKNLALHVWGMGFRLQAHEAHPDHGGSERAMAQLNRVNDRIRRFVNGW